MKVIGTVVVVVAAAILSMIWSGYVLSILWGWFIVPTFGCPSLSIPTAIGVACVVSYLTHQHIETQSDGDKSGTLKMFEAVVFAAMKPAIALFVGWIVQFWV